SGSRVPRCKVQRKNCWQSSGNSTHSANQPASVREMGLPSGGGGPLSRFESGSSVDRVGGVAEPRLELGAAGQPFAVAEPLVGIRNEIGVECVDRLLHDGPHSFTELTHHLHQLQPGP